MDKFEYSDLYKFLVSAGVIMIGLGVLLPWFYLKEPFDLMLEQRKMALLTSQAQQTIKIRQNLLITLYCFIPKISIGLVLLGLGSIGFGLFKWFKKQVDIDKRDLLTTAKLEIEVKGMDVNEVDKKNEKEYEEAVLVNEELPEPTLTTITTTKSQFINKYVKIEEYIRSRLTELFKNNFIILSNRTISVGSSNTFRYDILLQAIQASNDFIIEVKYYPRGVTSSTLREALLRLQTATIAYGENVNANVVSILIVVVPAEKYNANRFEALIDLPKRLEIEQTSVFYIEEEKLQQLSNETFINMLKG